MDAATEQSRSQATTLLRAQGRPCTFQRGANPPVDLNALISVINDSTDDREGFVVSFESWDFLCFPEDLTVAGVQTLPAIGDKFADETGAAYQVQPLPSGKHYRYTDPRRVMIRVHTKLIGEPA
jgi:hypothetical protein